MKFIIFVLTICLGVSFVLSSENQQNEHRKGHKEKSHHEKSKHHYDNRHHHTNNLRHHHQGIHQHGYRANDNNKHCSWVCTEEPISVIPSSFALQVIVNSTASLFGVAKKSSSGALIIDYRLDVIVLTNGVTGVTFVFIVPKQQLIRIPQLPESWNSSKSSFQDFFQTFFISRLLEVAQRQGQQIDIEKLPPSVANELENQLKSLGFNNLPIKESLAVITRFSSQLKNGLSALYQGFKIFNVQNNLKWFFNTQSVISELLQTYGFDLSKINIDPTNLFNGTNGVQILLNLFSQLGSNVDLSKFFSNLLNSREKTIQLLSNASAGSHNGLDGLATILVNIIKVTSQQGSFNDVITSILKYNSTSSDELTLTQAINQSLEIAKTQLKAYPNSESTGQIIKILEELNHNNLVINDVHIFDIIKIFLSPNPQDKISTIIKVLSNFAPQKGIPAIFDFIKNVLSHGNATVLTRLIPGLDLSTISGNGSFFENIIRGQNFTNLLSGGNIVSDLSNIPVFGQAAKQISAALGGGNLEKFFNPGQLLQIFTGGFGNLIPGIGTSNNSSQVGGIIGNIGSFFGLGGANTIANTSTNISSGSSASIESSTYGADASGLNGATAGVTARGTAEVAADSQSSIALDTNYHADTEKWSTSAAASVEASYDLSGYVEDRSKGRHHV